MEWAVWTAGGLLVLILTVWAIVAAVRDYNRLVRMRDKMREEDDERQ